MKKPLAGHVSSFSCQPDRSRRSAHTMASADFSSALTEKISPGWRGVRTRRSHSLFGVFPYLQYRQEGFLRDLHAAHALHALLARFLLFEQLALARDVAAVALGQDVLAHRRNVLARHDLVADGGLQRHFEHLPRDQLAQTRNQALAALEGEF